MVLRKAPKSKQIALTENTPKACKVISPTPRSGQNAQMIRKTDETPQRIYVINVAALITGKNHDAAAQDFSRMRKRYHDVSAN